MLITQIAFVLLIAFVANPLLDQLYSFFSVSEHPMQAGSTVHFFVCPVCWGVFKKIKSKIKSFKVGWPFSVA